MTTIEKVINTIESMDLEEISINGVDFGPQVIFNLVSENDLLNDLSVELSLKSLKDLSQEEIEEKLKEKIKESIGEVVKDLNSKIVSLIEIQSTL